jgi:hypothetical protein
LRFKVRQGFEAAWPRRSTGWSGRHPMIPVAVSQLKHRKLCLIQRCMPCIRDGIPAGNRRLTQTSLADTTQAVYQGGTFAASAFWAVVHE